MTRNVETSERVVAGRYRLREPLGRGGMGTVWVAHDELLQRPVAVKEVRPPEGVSDDERAVLRERTLREARAAARLDHPGAVRVFDVVEEDDRPFIVMELLTGQTLSDCLHESGPLPPARVADIGLQLLGALEAAHRAGIVHRDVKPGNVVCSEGGRVTLTDFGIASTAGDPSITSTGLLLGSPAYIAPERARGASPEPPSDFWSLGATLFTAVEGRSPFERDDPVATLTAVVTDEHEPFVRAGPLAPVLHRLLEKDPADRPTYAEIRKALRAAAREANAAPAVAEPVAAPPPETSTGGQTVALAPVDAGARPQVPRVGRLVAYALLALVVFVAAAAVGAVLTRGGHGRPEAAGKQPGGSTATTAALTATYRSPQGWSIRHPAGWVVQPKTVRGEQLTQIGSPTGDRYVRVEKSAGGASPRADWESFAPQFASSVSGYHQIAIRDTTVHGFPAASWEFTYTAGGTTWHALDVELVTPDATFAVLYQTKADQWAAAAGQRRAVLDSLRTG